jgi:hypothetical protein
MRKLEEILDLERWETWLYVVVLPAGFVAAGMLGALIGMI